ncbi:hypothetical protein LCGC14_1123940 [marine sediment metagenome]|uniref:Uncharacterized protein n=1 Tax=marine sediment metagenome TaxID=412755 RepID=A0A0F9MR13_9ZZZZ
MRYDFDIIAHIKEQIRIIVEQSRKELIEESKMEINEEVVKLKVQYKELQKDVDEIKEQVSNHIPTEIAAVKKVVYELRDTHIAETAVSQAWSNTLKKTAITVAIIFTLVRIAEFTLSVIH